MEDSLQSPSCWSCVNEGAPDWAVIADNSAENMSLVSSQIALLRVLGDTTGAVWGHVMFFFFNVESLATPAVHWVKTQKMSSESPST